MKSILYAGVSALALAGMLFAASPSQAYMVDVTVSAGDSQIDPIRPGGNLHLVMSGLQTDAISSALVTIMVFGDFNHVDEYIDLSVDGLSGGRWLNNTHVDDAFTGPVDDIGNQYVSTITGTATIDLVDLLPLLVDGELDFLFAYSNDVDDFKKGDLAKVRIQYESLTGPTVPEPSTMLLLGTGLLGVAVWRMKKGQV